MSLPATPSSILLPPPISTNISSIEYPPSSTSSSSSIVSRQSSVRSTNSVQAVPFRSPIRGPLANKNKPPVVSSIPYDSEGSTAVQSMNYFTTSGQSNNNNNNNGNISPNYFNAAPMMRQVSDGTSAGNSSSMYPSSSGNGLMNGSRNNSTTGLLDSFTFGNSYPIKSNGSNSAIEDLEPDTSSTDECSDRLLNSMKMKGKHLEVDDRPLIPRAASSNLSDKPAVKIIPGSVEKPEDSSTLIMRKTVSDFKFGEVLGEGSYSTVSKVTDRLPPYKQYALKVLDKEHIKREKKTKYVLIERDTLKILDGHPGIVRLYWTFQDARSLYYVLELAKNGELLKWIKKFGSFSLPCAKYYSAQILSAVEHIHSKNVIHRDLKPENILLDENMRVKITDFGTAKLLTEASVAENVPRPRSRSFVGTPEYVSPEILSEKKESSRSSDFWALGCIIFQIIAGRPPFQAKTEYLMFQKIIAVDYTFPPSFDPIAEDLVRKLLVLDPLLRLGGGSGKEDGIEAIKSHPFFEGIDFDTIWKIDVPELSSGIVGPKVEEKGEFVMPVGFERFVDDSDDEGAIDSEEEGEAEEERGLRAGVEKLKVVDTKVVEPITKWSGILKPEELILCASPILDRTSFISKKRTLILTDYPRLICIKETDTKVTLKSEVIIVPPSDGPSNGTNGLQKSHLGKLVFVKADMEGEKNFLVRTIGKTFKYEEPSPGGATRWISELRDVHSAIRSKGVRK